MNIWIIGAGGIAQEYAKVLNSLGLNYTVVGRGEKSALDFKKVTGKSVVVGGLTSFLATKPKIADKAIVATPLEALADNTIALLKYGVKNVFCEKPGFLTPEELLEVKEVSDTYNGNVFYAYNRRFFASVLKAEEIIKEEGGVKSFNFEFTEWGHVIEKSGNTLEALHNWMYANSTHVIDLAFFLGGNPTQMNCVTAGELSWHKPAIFAGSGITDKGALFSYQSNWAAPGRWVVEILTSKHRLYFKPMEQLQIQNIGSVKVDLVEIDDHLDKEFKPGFYLETKAFLEGDYRRLCSIKEQYDHLQHIYNKIKGL